jgi:ribonuclease BN (tRNA processing enzyme)
VTEGDESLLLDIGPGVFPSLLALGVLPDAIVVSHGHGDHCLGLLSLLNYLRFDRKDAWGIPVFAPGGVLASLAAFTGADEDHEFFEVFDNRVVESGDTVAIGGVELSFGAAVHSVPGLCTRVASGGKSVTYSGDTGPGSELADLGSGSDILLCEATYQGAPTADRYPYHLYASEAGAEARNAGVGQLLVTHVRPSLDPKVSVEEAAAVFTGPVEHAAPGVEVDA